MRTLQFQNDYNDQVDLFNSMTRRKYQDEGLIPVWNEYSWKTSVAKKYWTALEQLAHELGVVQVSGWFRGRNSHSKHSHLLSMSYFNWHSTTKKHQPISSVHIVHSFECVYICTLIQPLIYLLSLLLCLSMGQVFTLTELHVYNKSFG